MVVFDQQFNSLHVWCGHWVWGMKIGIVKHVFHCRLGNGVCVYILIYPRNLFFKLQYLMKKKIK